MVRNHRISLTSQALSQHRSRSRHSSTVRSINVSPEVAPKSAPHNDTTNLTLAKTTSAPTTPLTPRPVPNGHVKSRISTDPLTINGKQTVKSGFREGFKKRFSLPLGKHHEKSAEKEKPGGGGGGGLKKLHFFGKGGMEKPSWYITEHISPEIDEHGRPFFRDYDEPKEGKGLEQTKTREIYEDECFEAEADDGKHLVEGKETYRRRYFDEIPDVADNVDIERAFEKCREWTDIVKPEGPLT